jgi:hypothetical protein
LGETIALALVDCTMGFHVLLSVSMVLWIGLVFLSSYLLKYVLHLGMQVLYQSFVFDIHIIGKHFHDILQVGLGSSR